MVSVLPPAAQLSAAFRDNKNSAEFATSDFVPTFAKSSQQQKKSSVTAGTNMGGGPIGGGGGSRYNTSSGLHRLNSSVNSSKELRSLHMRSQSMPEAAYLQQQQQQQQQAHQQIQQQQQQQPQQSQFHPDPPSGRSATKMPSRTPSFHHHPGVQVQLRRSHTNVSDFMAIRSRRQLQPTPTGMLHAAALPYNPFGSSQFLSSLDADHHPTAYFLHHPHAQHPHLARPHPLHHPHAEFLIPARSRSNIANFCPPPPHMPLYQHRSLGYLSSAVAASQADLHQQQAVSTAAAAARRLSQSAKDVTQPLHVDCSVEYDLGNQPKIPKDSAPLLIIHPAYQQQHQQQQQKRDNANSGPSANSGSGSRFHPYSSMPSSPTNILDSSLSDMSCSTPSSGGEKYSSNSTASTNLTQSAPSKKHHHHQPHHHQQQPEALYSNQQQLQQQQQPGHVNSNTRLARHQSFLATTSASRNRSSEAVSVNGIQFQQQQQQQQQQLSAVDLHSSNSVLQGGGGGRSSSSGNNNRRQLSGLQRSMTTMNSQYGQQYQLQHQQQPKQGSQYRVRREVSEDEQHLPKIFNHHHHHQQQHSNQQQHAGKLTVLAEQDNSEQQQQPQQQQRRFSKGFHLSMPDITKSHAMSMMMMTDNTVTPPAKQSSGPPSKLGYHQHPSSAGDGTGTHHRRHVSSAATCKARRNLGPKMEAARKLSSESSGDSGASTGSISQPSLPLEQYQQVQQQQQQYQQQQYVQQRHHHHHHPLPTQHHHQHMQQQHLNNRNHHRHSSIMVASQSNFCDSGLGTPSSDQLQQLQGYHTGQLGGGVTVLSSDESEEDLEDQEALDQEEDVEEEDESQCHGMGKWRSSVSGQFLLKLICK